MTKLTNKDILGLKNKFNYTTI